MPYKQIGIVAVRTLPANKIKFYIGLARGENVEEDEIIIAKNGVPFNPYFLFGWANGIMKKVEWGEESEQKPVHVVGCTEKPDESHDENYSAHSAPMSDVEKMEKEDKQNG